MIYNPPKWFIQIQTALLTTVGTKKWAQNQLVGSEQFQTIKVWSSYRNIKLASKRISQLAVSLSLLYFVLNKECWDAIMVGCQQPGCLSNNKICKNLGNLFCWVPTALIFQLYSWELRSCIIVLILLHFVFSKCWYLPGVNIVQTSNRFYHAGFFRFINFPFFIPS